MTMKAEGVRTTRPAPDSEPHDGYEWRALPDTDWKLIRGGDFPGGRCRQGSGMDRRSCRRPAVAALRRPRYRSAGTWWAYCAEHMYSRWIEDGVVLCWKLREIGEPD